MSEAAQAKHINGIDLHKQTKLITNGENEQREVSPSAQLAKCKNL